MTPEALLATLAGLSTPAHDDQATGPSGPSGRAELVATVAETCPDCGEDYDEVGATTRCRPRHELRMTPATRWLYYRGLRADRDARASLTRAKRAFRAGDLRKAGGLLAAIPRHDWRMAMVNRLHAETCPRCAVTILAGDEDDRIAGSVRADPWALTNAGEASAIVLERPTWRLWGTWPAYRAVAREMTPEAVTRLPAASCTVVAAHVCGTRLDGEPIRAAVARVRDNGEIPF